MLPPDTIEIDLNTVIRAIPENLAVVRSRVADAAAKSGRDPGEVTVVAVSKTWPVEVVQAAVNAGADVLGENRIQEAQAKVPQISGAPAWHLVGHLQRNKARVAVDLFSTIQSVDSERLARELGKQAVAAGKTIDVLLQVNTSGEASKSGVRPEDAAGLARAAGKTDGLRVEGFMTIATLTDEVVEIRRCFRQLRELRDSVGELALPGVNVRHLSMGMTGDYEVAIEEGATIVRVGTGIFGRRTG